MFHDSSISDQIRKKIKEKKRKLQINLTVPTYFLGFLDYRLYCIGCNRIKKNKSKLSGRSWAAGLVRNLGSYTKLLCVKRSEDIHEDDSVRWKGKRNGN